MSDLEVAIQDFLNETSVTDNEKFLRDVKNHGLSFVFTPDAERLECVKILFSVLDSTGWEDVNARNIVAALRKALA
jgi:hypothetical protein